MLRAHKQLLVGSVLSLVLLVPGHMRADGFKISAPETKQHEGMSVAPLVPKSFYFIRHGQTDWNIENRLQGQLDIPLNDTGRKQAQALQDAVRLLDITHVYYSPLSRACETMQIACAHIPEIAKVPCASLMERNFGEWQGEIWDARAITTYRNAEPACGETEHEYFTRVITCANDLLTSTNGTLLMVAHGGVFWSLCKAAGVDYAAINNCCILHFVAPCEECDQWMIYEV